MGAGEGHEEGRATSARVEAQASVGQGLSAGAKGGQGCGRDGKVFERHR